MGQGHGSVVGAIEISDCDRSADLDEPEFDLDANYFVGQPLDPDQEDDTTRNSLWIRIQHGGANPEVADTLSIQVVDLDEVRPGTVEDVMAHGCQRNGVAADEGRGCVRADLAMTLSCPDSFLNLVAAADLDADGNPIPCPADEDVDLGGAFAGDFDDPEAFEDPFFDGDASDPDARHPSCIVFRSLGAEYGDEIAAVFHFAVRDARMVDAAKAGGYLRGRFRFELRSGPGAQAFP